MFARAVVVASAAAAVLGPAAPGQPPNAPPAAPKSLLVFYGWPSTINGAGGDVATAATHFAGYDLVVVGGGLEDPTHADHARTKAIIQAVGARTKFYGYVPLGNRPGRDKCLSDQEVAGRVVLVSKLGAKGVLLDEFGFDYGVTRARQNAAVQKAHAAGLAVIANAWDSDHVFRPDAAGVAPALKAGDAYLWESYRFQEGKAVGLKDWRARADKVAAGRKVLPLAVYSLSTNTVVANGDDARFAHQWFSAVIDGHDATGWGYPNFAAADSKAPRLTPPDKGKAPVSLGNRTDNPVQVAGSVVSKATEKGVVEVDADELTGKYSPKKGK